MKKLGLIGGTTWVSTVDYYTYINSGVNEILGGSSSAECLVYSLNFGEIYKNIELDDWDANLKIFTDAAIKLIHAGAEGIVLCANTAHIMADSLSERISVPIIHIVTATANEINQAGIKTAGLLGTKFTMERDFFKAKLSGLGIEAIIPDEEDREFIHNSIFNELGKNVFRPETKQRYISIIDKLISRGAEGIILGCTEIPLIIKQADSKITVFDTTKIHSKAAVDFALS
ncbi:MAG: aspartate/glutamate racemase family protein [Ignavibacteria bacterium]|nr:aspartate/glutamate racemase family protein [Ignavibacteria bacterium]